MIIRDSCETYRIIHRPTGVLQGTYSRGNYDAYDWESLKVARAANCMGSYEDKDKYRVDRYRITIELIEEGVDDTP